MVPSDNDRRRRLLGVAVLDPVVGARRTEDARGVVVVGAGRLVFDDRLADVLMRIRRRLLLQSRLAAFAVFRPLLRVPRRRRRRRRRLALVVVVPEARSARDGRESLVGPRPVHRARHLRPRVGVGRRTGAIRSGVDGRPLPTGLVRRRVHPDAGGRRERGRAAHVAAGVLPAPEVREVVALAHVVRVESVVGRRGVLLVRILAGGRSE